jgi:hypothetical protein
MAVSRFDRTTAGRSGKHAEPERAAFVRALEELDRALDGNIARTQRIKQRISELRKACASDAAIREVVGQEEPPLIVELLSENLEVLHTYGAALRQAEARVLHQEGMTMDQIAALFGVTRQRVAALVRKP